MKKSRDAFRTISEVAEWLDIPTHVLRFWESRFSQIKPVKRAGGRRYYRPSDMMLIGGVKVLLHDEGMTIRGVQKLLREKGIKHVAGFSPELSDTGEEEEDLDVVEHDADEAPPVFASRAARQTHAASPAPVAADAADTDRGDSQPDMFPETIAASVADEEVVEDAPAPARSIPATPDVPDTDRADDDPEISDAPGRAARLALASPGVLAHHREALLAARDRLSALRGKGAR
jgi:DNA-binding transcriptional MerR regulator